MYNSFHNQYIDLSQSLIIHTGPPPSSPAAGPLEQAPPEPLRRKPAKTRRGCRSASAAAVRHGPLPRKYPVRLYTMFTGLKTTECHCAYSIARYQTDEYHAENPTKNSFRRIRHAIIVPFLSGKRTKCTDTHKFVRRQTRRPSYANRQPKNREARPHHGAAGLSCPKRHLRNRSFRTNGKVPCNRAGNPALTAGRDNRRLSDIPPPPLRR